MSIPSPLQNTWLTNELWFCSYLLVTLTARVVTHDCCWRFKDKIGNCTKSVDNKCRLYHNKVSCNNGKGLFFFKIYASFFSMTELKGSTQINRQIRSNQRCIWKHHQQISNDIHIKWTINIDEPLVIFRDKCLLYNFIKSKPVNYGTKVWVAAFA